MTTLGELASLMRSKNAGPFFMTFDIMFADRERYERAVRSNVLTRETISEIYDVPAGDIDIYHYEPAFSIKFTFPRKVVSCDLQDTDTHGGQQFAPLVNLPVD